MQLRLEMINIETNPSLADAKLDGSKHSYLWCTLDCNYKRLRDSSCHKLDPAQAGHTYASFLLSSLVAGDVRVRMYMHRCKNSAEPRPSEEGDALVGYFWFHTHFAADARISSLGGAPGIEYRKEQIDVKLKGWQGVEFNAKCLFKPA